jgi:hypothetical protein
MVTPFPDRDRALRLCEILAAYTEIVSSTEFLARPADRRPGGVEYWGDAAGISPLRSVAAKALMRCVADARTTEALHVVRTAAATTVLVARGRRTRAAAGAVSVACQTLLHPRHRLSADGSDHAAYAVHAAVTLARAAGTPAAADAGLWFVALTSGLGYGAAGVAKLFSRPWRDGSAVPGVVALRGYGDPSLSGLFERHPWLGRALGAAVLAMECGFPLAWADRRGRLAPPIVLAALGFHVGNAKVMGLNRFLTAFAATYPAVLYTAAPAQSVNGGGRPRDDTLPRVAAGLAVVAAGVVAGAALVRRLRRGRQAVAEPPCEPVESMAPPVQAGPTDVPWTPDPVGQPDGGERATATAAGPAR